MNKEDILKTEAGKEIDLLIAEHIMGWYVSPSGLVSQKNKPGDFVIDACEETPFSTNIGYAWLVADKLKLTIAPYKDGKYHAADGTVIAWADTAPLAICRAALLTTLTEDE